MLKEPKTIQEKMAALKFPQNNFKNSEGAYQYDQRMIGGSPSEIDHKYEFSAFPADFRTARPDG